MDGRNLRTSVVVYSTNKPENLKIGLWQWDVELFLWRISGEIVHLSIFRLLGYFSTIDWRNPTFVCD